MPGKLVLASSSGVFLKIEEKSTENLVAGVLEVVNHEDDIDEGGRYTWCPRSLCRHHFRELFFKIEEKSFGNSFSGVYQVANHEYDIGEGPKGT